MLEAQNVAKRYGGVVALRETTFTVRPGTVHALLGENGAGKSTLVKILTGTVRPDSGRLVLNDEVVRFANNADAVAAGVAVVSQELRLFPDLSILANLYTMREPKRGGVLIDLAKMRRDATPVLADLGLSLDVSRPLSILSLADRQLVEIAGALLTNPSVLVLDEPTSALETASTARLLGVVDVLRRRGVGVVYVSHMLEEVLSLSDEITVLRDGATVLSAVPRAELSVSSIATAMLGESGPDAPVAEQPAPIAASSPIAASAPEPSGRSRTHTGRLIVEGVAVKGAVAPVSFSTQAGEIVGLSGVVGAGHQAVLDVIAGLRRLTTGAVTLPDGRALPSSRRAVVAAGVATVSGDRRRYGLMLEKPLWENIGQVQSVALARSGLFVRPSRLRSLARIQMAELSVRASSPDALAGSLSGGNQQKVVLAKWLESKPQVLLLDDPTRGVDIGAKAEMHRLIRALADDGVVVVLCSTDISEMADLCDRVLVFRRQDQVGELAGADLTEHALLESINALPDLDHDRNRSLRDAVVPDTSSPQATER
jgi:ABC-type sugar transport system ATPase subunit